MAAKTYAELLTVPTATAEKTRIIAKLAAANANGGFPVTSWAEGDLARTLVESEADATVERAGVIKNIATGGLTEEATGDWLKLRAKQLYNIDYDPATRTAGTLQLYLASGSSAQTIAANQLWFKGQGGNRYQSTGTGTLAAVGFTAVTQTGGGTGTVTPTAGSPVPTGYQSASANGKSYKVEVVAGGGLGVGTYKISSDGGTTYGQTKTIPGGGVTTADPETGVILTFANSFNAGTTYTWTSGGQLNVAVQSEFVNNSAAGRNYIDANSTITDLLTPLPGVTTKNFPPLLSTVLKSGTGTGAVEVRPKTYAAITATSINIEIRSPSGQIGSAKFRYQVDGGAFTGDFTTPSAAAPELTRGVYNDATLNALNVELWFSNGSVNPSFVAGDFYSFTAPGSWITTQGTDEQNDASLRSEAKNQWSTLSPIPTNPLYEVWAKAASNQVTRVRVYLSATINNRVEIILAGQAGAVAASVVTTVDAYVRARMPITDRINVASAAAQAVTLGGATVRVKATNLTSAQTKAQQNIATYIAQVGLGDGSTVKVTHAQIIEAILRESGSEADNVTGLTINGSTSDLTPTTDNVPTFTQTLSSALTWTTY